MSCPVQYQVLLCHHAALFEHAPPVYSRDESGQWTCSYMGNVTAVDAETERLGRSRSARLMWIFTKIRHPFPPR